MPIININVTKPLSAEVKQDIMESFACAVCESTSTLMKNIYVYIHEMPEGNYRKKAPTAVIDWTMMPDRTLDAKKAIMTKMTNKLSEITEPELTQEIVIIFNDIPLANAMLGGETRADNPVK